MNRLLDDILNVIIHEFISNDLNSYIMFSMINSKMYKYLSSIAEDKCIRKQLDCYEIIRNNHFTMLKWMYINDYTFQRDMATFAASCDNFKIVKWLIKRNNERLKYLKEFSALLEPNFKLCSGHPNCIHVEHICAEAARVGNFDMVQWAHKNKFSLNGGVLNAIKSGNIRIVKWLRKDMSHESIKITACIIAVEYNRFEILKWLVNIGCPLTTQTYTMAIRKGHFDILKWIHTRCIGSYSNCLEAVRSNHFEILKWLFDHGIHFDDEICYFAARYGRLEIFKWAYNFGCKTYTPYQLCLFATQYECTFSYYENILSMNRYNESAIVHSFNDTDDYFNIIRSEQFEIIKWLYYKEKVVWDDNIFYRICQYDDLEMIKWMIDTGCIVNLSFLERLLNSERFALIKWICDYKRNDSLDKWNDQLNKCNEILDNVSWYCKICDKSVQTRNFEILKWAHERGGSLININSYPRNENNFEMLKWIKNHCNLSWQSDKIKDLIVDSNNLSMLKWAYKNGFPLTNDVYLQSIYNNNMAMIKWAQKNDCPMCCKISTNVHELLTKSKYIIDLKVYKWYIANWWS